MPPGPSTSLGGSGVPRCDAQAGAVEQGDQGRVALAGDGVGAGGDEAAHLCVGQDLGREAAAGRLTAGLWALGRH
jgi:hypothetical protein